MEQEINYGGHSTTPSDYVSKDGDLAVAVNLLNENGSVGVVLPPKVMRQLPSDTAAVYVHDTAKMKHYILVLANGDIYWADAEGLWGLEDTGYNIQGIEKVVPLGNTLCILSQNGMDYLLWKDGEGEYKRLSPNLPEIKLSFGLQCEADSYTNSQDLDHERLNHQDEDNRPKRKLLEANLNTHMNLLKNKGRFCMPFFVRYAYRLFDESVTMASAPILMTPISGIPFVFLEDLELKVENRIGTDIEFESRTLYVTSYFPSCQLDMQYVYIPSNLSDYSDIIRSVDIFVSTGQYTYNTNITAFPDEPLEEIGIYDDWNENFGVYKIGDSNYSRFPSAPLISGFAYDPAWVIGQEHPRHYTDEVKRIKLEANDALMENLASCNLFYFVKRMGLDELSGYENRKIINIAGTTLTYLNQKETLPDDFDSHNQKIANAAFSYNQRLLIADVSNQLFEGYANISYANAYDIASLTESPYGYSGNGTEYTASYTTSSYNPFVIQDVRVKVKKEGREYTLKETGLTPFCTYDRYDIDHGQSGHNDGGRFLFWFYYPDADAYEVILSGYFQAEQNDYILKLPLKRHDFLNGAYYFSNFEWIGVYHYATQPVTESEYLAFLNTTYPVTTDNSYEQPNKLYTSEVLNPWYFPVEGIVTVGNGEVKALAAATQALSQGQFGQFPLYAFCSDGVWALTVGQTGYFTSSHPVSRDVCTNPDGVTQIDSAVIYPTERGLMLLVGSTNKCFTDELYDKGETTIVNTLTGMDELLTRAELTRAVLPEVSFIEYMEGCKMVYDYVRQRITVYNPSRYPASPGQTVGERKYKYAYVYSLKTNKWGMVESNLEWTTNSYPEALAMTDDKKLVDVSGERGSSAKVKGLLVTRPLKLGDGDIYKSIHTMIQRGMFERGDVGCVLWGSRDLYHWHLVGSSKTHELRMLRGTGYKYYRIGLLVDLPESKSVSRATIELEGRNMNEMR